MNDFGDMRSCQYCGAGNCGESCAGAQHATVARYRIAAEKAQAELKELTNSMRLSQGVRVGEFIDLCAKLRGLGATKVSCGDFSAEFTPISGSAVVPVVAGRQRQDEPKLTPEQANEERTA